MVQLQNYLREEMCSKNQATSLNSTWWSTAAFSKSRFIPLIWNINQEFWAKLSKIFPESGDRTRVSVHVMSQVIWRPSQPL